MNRKIIGVFAIAFATICSMDVANAADNYPPILQDGRKWHVTTQQIISGGEIEIGHYWIEVDKDTVINNIPSKKLICTPADETIVKDPEFFYATEENGSLYGFYLYKSFIGEYEGEYIYEYEWIKEDVLCMDCEIGMHFGSPNHGLNVIDIDHIYVNDSQLRRITLTTPEGSNNSSNTYWVEGIGAYDSNGWIFNWIPAPAGSRAEGSILDSCLISVEEIYDNDALIFTKEDFTQEVGIKTVMLDSERTDAAMYDTFGQRIKIPQKGSVCIFNGRKFIAR